MTGKNILVAAGLFLWALGCGGGDGARSDGAVDAAGADLIASGGRSPDAPMTDGAGAGGTDSDAVARDDAASDTHASDTSDAPDLDEKVDVSPTTDANPDAGVDTNTPDPGKVCSLGKTLAGVHVAPGFCVREFAAVQEARTLVLAPNGDIFVGAPSMPTPGGASDGPGAILVLADDNHDGTAEVHTFAQVPDVHGVTIGGGYLYFTTSAEVWRTPLGNGQRTETPGGREPLNMPPSFGTGGRWTHGLARSPAGKLLVSRGEYGTCGMQNGGEVSQIGAGPPSVLARGLRNPMYLRCHAKDEVCAAAELGEDLARGALEKMILIRPDTRYGYPCCFGANVPGNSSGAMTCDDITREDASFVLSETPFGFDWESGGWPAPHAGGLFVALHGSAYSTPAWSGARIVYAPTDPTTHAPVQDWQDFVTGFGPGGAITDRPSDVVFAPDGRMYFSDDQGGHVFWVAPESLSISR